MTKGVKAHCFVDKCPPMFLVDTPGLVLPPDPYTRDTELYYKLWLLKVCKTSQDHSRFDVAEYVLWKCNSLKNYCYVAPLQLPGPTDDIKAVLQHMEPDLKFAAQAAAEFISICWEHGLNQMVLDDLLLTSDDEARAHEIPLQWDEDEMMMATNFRTGFLLH
mmetsp:Transcript_26439/g.43924  ORF Transcript_26439/g.43924 Transcript_26439/m.43924 type:complete len:162 (+) Transcript_26439:3-488(+)